MSAAVIVDDNTRHIILFPILMVECYNHKCDMVRVKVKTDSQYPHQNNHPFSANALRNSALLSPTRVN